MLFYLKNRKSVLINVFCTNTYVSPVLAEQRRFVAELWQISYTPLRVFFFFEVVKI